MGLLLLLTTLGLEAGGVWASYWYGDVAVVALLRYCQWSLLFPDTPIPAQAIGWIFVLLNLAGHLFFGILALSRRWRVQLSVGRLTNRQIDVVRRTYDQIQSAADLAGRRVRFISPRRLRYRLGPDLRIDFTGGVLIIDDTLLKSPYLPPLLTHALGHYNSSDVSVRSMLDLFPPARACLCCFVGLPFGIGAVLMSGVWLWYWRGREYQADRFVAMVGQAAVLVEALETIEQPREAAGPQLFRLMPDTELRIDQLLRWQDRQMASSKSTGGSV